MKTLLINSKKYGELAALIDDEDYERLTKDFKNMKWCITRNHKGFYAQKRTEDGIVYLHRYIMNNPDGYVDHINKNTLDNRKQNLRVVSNADNLRNGTLRTNNSTGIKGVYYDKSRNKYTAEIKVNYKKVFLGRFATIEEAASARKNAEIKYWEEC